jgi:hypothetical protein
MTEISVWALGAFILFHGILDTATTIPYWEYEGNPIAVRLGFHRWLLTKAVIVVGVFPAYYIGQDNPLMPVILIIGTLPGAGVVLWNVYNIAKVKL